MPEPHKTKLVAEQFWRSGNYFVHNVDPLGLCHVIRVEAGELDRSSFLDHRIELEGKHEQLAVNLKDLAPSMSPRLPARGAYICHISHVGSTLIAKLLGLAHGVISLREPMLLRWLAEMQADAGEAESLTSRDQYLLNLRFGIGLLNRPFEGRDHILIKATSFASPVVRDALAIQPEARVLALFVPAESFAANILKKRTGLYDIMSQAPQRLKRLHTMLGQQKWRLFELSPGELTAMSWLAEMATLHQMQELAGDGLRWLDFEAFLTAPDTFLPELCRHFGIGWPDDDEARLRASELMGRYAKTNDVAYSAADRAAEMAQARSEQGEEIARAVRWVERALAEHPGLLPMEKVYQQGQLASAAPVQ